VKMRAYCIRRCHCVRDLQSDGVVVGHEQESSQGVLPWAFIGRVLRVASMVVRSQFNFASACHGHEARGESRADMPAAAGVPGSPPRCCCARFM
jgi:hypothetical protein